ncbi:hypothetical protein [Streptomyces inhibens]|uniref:hypothetical protein n=1 Tax=Streptomyces inhibens TaxID=2293571 RepID=UPI001EE735A6|nr:hypothetical protein [Streptomyces inhibens]UKY50574.1 hypothetical protein KI385_18280 [Streptomyces inhibens]
MFAVVPPVVLLIVLFVMLLVVLLVRVFVVVSSVSVMAVLAPVVPGPVDYWAVALVGIFVSTEPGRRQGAGGWR